MPVKLTADAVTRKFSAARTSSFPPPARLLGWPSPSLCRSDGKDLRFSHRQQSIRKYIYIYMYIYIYKCRLQKIRICIWAGHERLTHFPLHLCPHVLTLPHLGTFIDPEEKNKRNHKSE